MGVGEEDRGHTSKRQVEGKTLLAETGVEMLHYTEVGVMSVLVVHCSNVKLPTGNHDEVQVWNCKKNDKSGFMQYGGKMQSVF